MERTPRPDPELAVALRVMREERGISREELADRCGIPAESLALIESGQTAPPGDTVRRLLQALCAGASIDLWSGPGPSARRRGRPCQGRVRRRITRR